MIRYNAAGSHWQVGMSFIKAGAWGRGVPMLLRASAIDPRFVLWLLRHRTGRGYEETVRPGCAEVMTGRAQRETRHTAVTRPECGTAVPRSDTVPARIWR